VVVNRQKSNGHRILFGSSSLFQNPVISRVARDEKLMSKD